VIAGRLAAANPTLEVAIIEAGQVSSQAPWSGDEVLTLIMQNNLDMPVVIKPSMCFGNLHPDSPISELKTNGVHGTADLSYCRSAVCFAPSRVHSTA
jgi:hypothetical protein